MRSFKIPLALMSGVPIIRCDSTLNLTNNKTEHHLHTNSSNNNNHYHPHLNMLRLYSFNVNFTPSTLCSSVRFSSSSSSTPLSPQVSREVALARWSTSKESTTSGNKEKEKEKGGIIGKGMSFASSLGILGNSKTTSNSSRKGPSTSTASGSSGSSNRSTMDVTTSAAEIDWDLCERMDYLLQYAVPSNWLTVEQVRENAVSIQSTPAHHPIPASAGPEQLQRLPSVHGISVNCFAYKRKVPEPDCGKLLRVFLKRFNVSVNNSLEILSEACVQREEQPVPPPSSPPHPTSNNSNNNNNSNNSNPSIKSSSSSSGVGEGGQLVDRLAQQLNCAIAEISFTPGPGQPLARGLCRAFYNSNGRYHYIVIVAVPEDEYSVSQDLVVHALIAAVESRVESAAKFL